MDLSGLRNYESNGILTEALLQKGFVDILRDLGYFVCHINNNTASKLAGIRAKEMGVVAGIPDLILFIKGKVLLIELKRLGGRVSKDQKIFHQRLLDLEIPVYVVVGVSGIEIFLSDVLNCLIDL